MIPSKAFLIYELENIKQEQEREEERLEEFFHEYFNSTNLVGIDFVGNFYLKAKELLKAESDKARLVKKTELVYWLIEQYSKFKIYDNETNEIFNEWLFEAIIVSYLHSWSCHEGEEFLIELWAKKVNIFERLETAGYFNHFNESEKFCDFGKNIDRKKALEEELYLCEVVIPCGLGSYNSRTTPEEIERYHKYEVDTTVYGAYKRVDSALKTYMPHVKDYTEFELDIDVIKIIKDQGVESDWSDMFDKIKGDHHIRAICNLDNEEGSSEMSNCLKLFDIASQRTLIVVKDQDDIKLPFNESLGLQRIFPS